MISSRTISLTRVLGARSFQTSAVAFANTPSPLENRLRDGLKIAMKSKDRQGATCIKSVLAEVTNAAKAGPNPNDPASESSVIKAIRQGVAQRREAAQSYTPTGPSPSPENYAALTNEISLLESYLPIAPSPAELSRTIGSVIDSLSEEARKSKGVVGNVMKGVMDKLGDMANSVDRKEIGKMIGEAVKKLS